MSNDGSTDKSGDESAKKVAKYVEKILSAYLKQVFGPMIKDIKKIDEKVTRMEAEITKLNEAISSKGIQAASMDDGQLEETIQKAVDARIAEAEQSQSAKDESKIEREIATASSKKEYIRDEMVKVADFFEAKDLPDSQLYEKRELKEKIKEILSFLNKEAGSAGTAEGIISVIQNMIKVVKDIDYKLNSSLQARFYKDDFVDFIGRDAGKQIRKVIKELG